MREKVLRELDSNVLTKDFLKMLEDNYSNDREVMLELVKIDDKYIAIVSPRLLRDKEFVIDVAKVSPKCDFVLYFFKHNPKCAMNNHYLKRFMSAVVEGLKTSNLQDLEDFVPRKEIENSNKLVLSGLKHTIKNAQKTFKNKQTEGTVKDD